MYQEMIINNAMNSFTFDILADIVTQILTNLEVLSTKLTKMPCNEIKGDNTYIN